MYRSKKIDYKMGLEGKRRSYYTPINIHNGNEEMGSYDEFINGNGRERCDHLYLQGENCALLIEGDDHNGDGEDVHEALRRSRLASAKPADVIGGDIPASKASPAAKSRLVSLDVFRGFTVVIMILVDNAGGLFPAINHSPWNGLTLADLVMPFFLFMVGMSLGLVYKNLSCRVAATKKATCRALKLLVLGLFLQGGYFHRINDLTYGVDVEEIRWMGILQRVATAYLVAAACEIWLKGDGEIKSGLSLLKKYQYQWVVVLMLTAFYLCLLYGLYVPDWEYQMLSGTTSSAAKVKCGVWGDTGPACNAVGMIDRKILGIRHLYRRPIYARTKQCSINSPDYGPLPPDAPSWCRAPFEPEGLLSSVMAIVTCLIGLHYGHIIVHFKDHKSRLLHWLIPSSCLLILGVSSDFFGMHINKVLYTFSYTCVTAGAAGILFAGIYIMVDACRYRRLTTVLEWIGMNALLIYALVGCNILPVIIQGIYWKHPHNNILTWVAFRAREVATWCTSIPL